MKKKSLFIKIIVILVATLLIFLAGLLFLFYSFSFQLVGEKEVEISYKKRYEEMGAHASIFGFDLSDDIKIDGEVKDGVIGDYIITYSYTFFFFPFQEERMVHLKDMDKPTIELKGESVSYICPSSKYKEDGYTAYDEVDGDLTDKVETIYDDSLVSYKVVDSSGNETIVKREIKKEDSKKPTISLVGSSTVYVKQNDVYSDLGYSASDDCDGNITNRVKVEGNVDTKNLGTYTLVYSVTDSNGNQNKVERVVVVSNSKEDFGVVYLTFDDGPSNSGSTAKILDVLNSEGVKATFFVTGSGADSLMKRMHDEGHTIALHTYTHQYQDIYHSVDSYFKDLEKIKNRVQTITGQDVKIIRFPGGSNNTVSNQYHFGIMSVLRQEVLRRGYSYFDWNVDASDAYNCAKSSVKDKKKCVYNNVVNNLSKKRSNVVLMHDSKSYTADSLSKIIKNAKAMGYIFDVLNEETTPIRFR